MDVVPWPPYVLPRISHESASTAVAARLSVLRHAFRAFSGARRCAQLPMELAAMAVADLGGDRHRARARRTGRARTLRRDASDRRARDAATARTADRAGRGRAVPILAQSDLCGRRDPAARHLPCLRRSDASPVRVCGGSRAASVGRLARGTGAPASIRGRLRRVSPTRAALALYTA